MIEKLCLEFKEHWKGLGYNEPSAIQSKTFEPLVNNQDLVGISPTGTGKTVAYTLPVLQKIEKTSELQLLVLVPSQELAVQVASVLKEWSDQIGLSVQTIIGGANRKRQIEKLKDKPEIVVGTPGRILELAKEKKLKMHKIKTMIFDEADHLLQEEQLKAVKQIISKAPGNRQLVFYSATSNEKMETLPEWFNIEPIWIDVTEEDKSKGHLMHAYIETPTRKRTETLKRLVQVEHFRGLVFVNNVANLTMVYEKLLYQGVSVAVLHSEKYKTERKKALQQFRDGKIQLLLTTDLASRGLDIPELPYVIQYDLPLSKQSYIHRSGRTARMKSAGTIITLLNERELRELKKITSSLDVVLTPLYLYDRKLVFEKPKVNKDEKDLNLKESRISKKTHSDTTRFQSTTKDNASIQKKKKRKKNKNKGARRKKKV